MSTVSNTRTSSVAPTLTGSASKGNIFLRCNKLRNGAMLRTDHDHLRISMFYNPDSSFFDQLAKYKFDLGPQHGIPTDSVGYVEFIDGVTVKFWLVYGVTVTIEEVKKHFMRTLQVTVRSSSDAQPVVDYMAAVLHKLTVKAAT